MKKLFFFSFIYLLLLSGAKKNDSTFVNPVTVVDTNHKSYLALGDSYTIGESVAGTERGRGQYRRRRPDVPPAA